jgi:hypothetical protein
MPPPTIVTDRASAVDDLALVLDLGSRFPTPVMVTDALNLFGRVLPRGLLQGAREGRDFYLACGPGTVGVRMTDSDRRERTAAANRGGGYDAGLGPMDLVAGGQLLGASAAGLWAAEIAEIGRDALDPNRPAVNWGRLSSRVITCWTRKSRRNMTRALAELDYRPLFASGRCPAMLTLTYPGNWEALAPSGKAVKAHLRALWKRWDRAWGARPPALWKLEFQRRGAPHLHLFAVPEVGTVDVDGEPVDFRRWLSRTWADIIGARATCDRYGYDYRLGYHAQTELVASELAGTGVDYREGSRMTDPKRLAVYFTKHGGAAGGKEYQHDVPALWQTPETGPGRFWGVVGLDRVRREVGVTQQDYTKLRRTLRRWSKAQGLTRTRRVPRGRSQLVDADGETEWHPSRDAWTVALLQDREWAYVRQRKRHVTRRAGYLTQGGWQGGWLCVNDGPAFVSQLAAVIEPRSGAYGSSVLAWRAADGRTI